MGQAAFAGMLLWSYLTNCSSYNTGTITVFREDMERLLNLSPEVIKLIENKNCRIWLDLSSSVFVLYNVLFRYILIYIYNQHLNFSYVNVWFFLYICVFFLTLYCCVVNNISDFHVEVPYAKYINNYTVDRTFCEILGILIGISLLFCIYSFFWLWVYCRKYRTSALRW